MEPALDFRRYLAKAELDKAVNGLLGLVEGVAMDGRVSAPEVSFFRMWLEDNQRWRGLHPFTELVPLVERSVEDGVLAPEEREDLTWLCEKLRSEQYFRRVTGDMQRLHAIVGGIAADRVIAPEELRGLSAWMEEHAHLQRCWPFDEFQSVVTGVMRDGRIDPREHELMLQFFSEFTPLLDDRTITQPLVSVEERLVGLCAVCPEIVFAGSSFCFTGASTRLTRAGFHELVRELGGTAQDSVTKKLDFLVIGADGNPCWCFAAFGRKAERAVELRKQGAKLMIVHENDFHDAVQDAR